MDKPERREEHKGLEDDLLEAGLAIACGILVDAISPGSGEDFTKQRMPGDIRSNRRRVEIIPAVYNYYDSFYLTCDITLGSEFLGPNQNGRERPNEVEDETVKKIRIAAEQGDADAQNRYGACYHEGEGVEKDLKQAVYWFRKAANQGFAKAQYNLGRYYEYGLGGLNVSKTDAAYWFSKAAEQGFAEAQNRYGACYHEGEGVEKDLKQAVYWYRKAANQGFAKAQYNLGLCYEYGLGGYVSRTDAVYWYSKAAEQGFVAAEERLKQLN